MDFNEIEDITLDIAHVLEEYARCPSGQTVCNIATTRENVLERLLWNAIIKDPEFSLFAEQAIQHYRRNHAH